jgi:hypothetical protein
MVFHVKRDYTHTNLKMTPPSTAVEPITVAQYCFSAGVSSRLRNMIGSTAVDGGVIFRFVCV